MTNSIRVTFPQVVILLASVVVIGILLFYMGYRAGKSSPRESVITRVKDNGTEYQEIKVKQNRQKDKETTGDLKGSSIRDEIKLHRQTTQNNQKAAKKKSENRVKKPYYSIQVGAFSISAKAQKYADKFDKMGYPAEISPRVINNRKLYIVRVGNYADKAKAVQAKKKLEKKEKAKFLLVSSD